MDDTFGDFTSSSDDPAVTLTSPHGLGGGAGTHNDVDPEADFLAREQAAFAAIQLNDALPAAVTSPLADTQRPTSAAMQPTLFGTFLHFFF